ncbi:alpha-galactosidase [Clostridium saccharobutylicum]|uniref:Alpha-galactosidase n=1 Tax=Clostridium saccharobutylicum TaxID=169679 RepID=A0A1S8NBP1_CLOSA|nr:alpha-galactosidase [Clostridium saccharobutylicum]OOM13904.1 alpha-galactosidase [Clostridium saccharobutylicum]
MIIIDKDKKIFHLRTKKMSYVFRILKNGSLGHLYYGDTLSEDENFDYLANVENKAAGTIKYYENDSKFSLGAETSEFNIYGTGDFRQPAIELRISNRLFYPEFAYVDHEITYRKERIPEVPRVYGDEYENLTITLKDKNLNLYLKLNYSITDESSAIVRSSSLINTSQHTYTISRFMSGTLDIPSADLDFISLSGAWLRERHLVRQPLRMGIQSVGSVRGASSHQQNPFIMLAEKNANEFSGTVYAASLVYSGNFLAQTEVDEWNVSRILIGINPMNFAWQLKPGDEFKTPECIFAVTQKGFNEISHTFHNIINDNIVEQRYKNFQRPIVVNSWEANYFNFDENSLLKLADLTTKIGADTLIVDDGWFGERDSTKKSLGDWFEDKRKFPHGIGKFAEHIHEKGLKLGLWFEPEMVDPDSDLYRAHPEWSIGKIDQRRSFGRGQLVLDMANPEVIDYLIASIDSMIERTKLDYIKWDMNRNITEAFSNYLDNEHQGELLHRYIMGVYKLMSHICEKYPDIIIENCAGGGGRFDLGMLYYSPQIWTSDDSDGVERLMIQYGTSMCYPLSSLSNHVTAVPNHQIDRVVPLNFRNNVSTFGVLGYELDLSELSEDELNEIKDQVSEYRKRQKLIFSGTFSRLKSPFCGNETAWQVVSKNKEEVLVGWYKVLAKPNQRNQSYLKLVGLEKDYYYSVSNDDTIHSGAALMNMGIRLPYDFNGANQETAQISGDFQSELFTLRKVNKKVI